METFELLPSLAQGDLADTSAPELVAAVYRSRASGTLWVEAKASEIRMFFRSGEMCGSGFFTGFRTLAHVLLENEWVDAIEIDSSREEAEKSKKRHGEVLVAKGLLTHEQLNTALGAQHQANLATLLALTAGKYDWRGSEPPPTWARTLSAAASCATAAPPTSGARTRHRHARLAEPATRHTRNSRRPDPASARPSPIRPTRPNRECGHDVDAFSRLKYSPPPTSLSCVVRPDNATRVRDGYTRLSTRGHPRTSVTPTEELICRENVAADARG